jgi:hypothetical protein
MTGGRPIPARRSILPPYALSGRRRAVVNQMRKPFAFGACFRSSVQPLRRGSGARVGLAGFRADQAREESRSDRASFLDSAGGGVCMGFLLLSFLLDVTALA